MFYGSKSAPGGSRDPEFDRTTGVKLILDRGTLIAAGGQNLISDMGGAFRMDGPTEVVRDPGQRPIAARRLINLHGGGLINLDGGR